MRTQRFFIVSLILAVLAIALQLNGMSQASRGMQIRARAVTMFELDKAAAKMEAGSFSRRGTVFVCVGIALALASAGFAVVSARRHEPARRSVVLGLLICYVLLQFVLI